MERTKWRKLTLPDAINRFEKTGNYTMISNDFIKNPKLGAEAKTIMLILLSNKEGWISNKKTLKTMMKEGRDSIQKGFKELKEYGYWTDVQFCDKTTKEFKGSFWAITEKPFDFIYHKNKATLESKGFEVIVRKPAILPRNTENPLYGKAVTNNIIIKNKTKRTEISDEISSIKSKSKHQTPFVPYITCGKNCSIDPGWRYLDRDKEKNRIIDDGILYVKCTDDYYRHGLYGNKYFP